MIAAAAVAGALLAQSATLPRLSVHRAYERARVTARAVAHDAVVQVTSTRVTRCVRRTERKVDCAARFIVPTSECRGHRVFLTIRVTFRDAHSLRTVASFPSDFVCAR